MIPYNTHRMFCFEVACISYLWCILNYTKCSGLRQQTFINSYILWVRNLDVAELSLLSQGFSKAAMTILVRAPLMENLSVSQLTGFSFSPAVGLSPP